VRRFTKAKGESIVVLTNTSASFYGSLLANLITKYPNAKHVVYDAVSESNALDVRLWC
jgi:molybdopterin-containing oxidoreductase family iron-sulfur binding subunit